MKNVFLVGKLNSVVQNIRDVLEDHFHVQLTSDNPEVVKGMIKVSSPDLILICLIDMKQEQEEIFTELQKRYASIPVVCLGTKDELAAFKPYIDAGQYEVLMRPITISSIVRKLWEMLGIAQENEETQNNKGGVHKKSILLIDDSAVQLRMMKGLLQDRFNIEMAKSGDVALKIIMREKPDMIFLDYDMPGQDGKATLEKIRAYEPAKNTPVVFLTGVKDRARIQAVLSLKPAGYILKPVSQDQIMDIIKTVLKE
ncbi:MAG: response regulator [Wujia sp.]